MADVKKALQRLLAELEEEDRQASADELRRELEELRGRQGLTREELDEHLNTWLDGRLNALEAEYDAREGQEEPDDGDGSEEPSQEPTRVRTRTRPGRRSGNVYNWELDEGGNVVQLPIAKVYDGPDEPDRVPLDPADDDDEPGEEAS